MYATPDNFTGQLLYGDLKEAYLHPDAAKALLQAHLLLKAEHPDYRLMIYDAARPMSVQKKMWDVVKEPLNISMYLIRHEEEDCIIMAWQ